MVSNTSETLLKKRNYWAIRVVIALLLCWAHVYAIKVNWKSELKSYWIEDMLRGGSMVRCTLYSRTKIKTEEARG